MPRTLTVRQCTCDLSTTSSNENGTLSSVTTFGRCSIDETSQSGQARWLAIQVATTICVCPSCVAEPRQSTVWVRNPLASCRPYICYPRRGPHRASDSRFSGLSTIPDRLNEDAAPRQAIMLARRFAAGLVTIERVLFY